MELNPLSLSPRPPTERFIPLFYCEDAGYLYVSDTGHHRVVFLGFGEFEWDGHWEYEGSSLVCTVVCGVSLTIQGFGWGVWQLGRFVHFDSFIV